MKRILPITGITALLCALCISAPTMAAETTLAQENLNSEIIITPYMTIIDQAKLTSSYKSGGKIYVTAYIYSSISTKVTTQAKLYRKTASSSTWSLWQTGGLKSGTNYAEISNSWSYSNRYDYKVVCTFIGYKGSSSETRTISKVLL